MIVNILQKKMFSLIIMMNKHMHEVKLVRHYSYMYHVHTILHFFIFILNYVDVLLAIHCTSMKFRNDGRFDMINLRKMFSRHSNFPKIMKFTNESISLICGPVFPGPC